MVLWADTTYVSIFLFSHAEKTAFDYYKVPSLPFEAPAGFNACYYEDFDDEPWSFVFSDAKKLLKKLQSMPLITERAFAKGGIISGNDSCFLFSPDEFPAESEMGLKLLRTDDIGRYYVGNPSLRIFYPCELNPQGDTEVIELNKLKADYPLAYQHITKNEGLLKSRKDSRNVMGDKAHWYQPVRFGTLKLFNGPKILGPGIVKHNKFTLDEEGCAFSFGNMYAIVAKESTLNLKTLLGILNSSLIEYFLHQTAPVKQGGYYSYGATILERIPLVWPNVEREGVIADKVDAIIAAKKADANADTSALEAEIDDIVFDLYGLTAEERALVQGAGK